MLCSAQNPKLNKQFNTALETIAALNSSLKLKQVTLLREAKIMEHIQSSLEDCEQKLNACAFVPAAADLTASCLKLSGVSTNSRRFSTVNSTEIIF